MPFQNTRNPFACDPAVWRFSKLRPRRCRTFPVGFQLLGPRDRIYAGIDGTSPGSYASFTKKPKSTCPVDNPAIPQSVPDV